MKRITIRFNDREEADLNLLKKTFGIVDDSKAVKLGVKWVNGYLINVTRIFFPYDYDVVLYKKTQYSKKGTRVYDEE